MKCTVRDMTLVSLKTAPVSFMCLQGQCGKKREAREEERDILTVDCDFYCFGVRRGDVI